MAREFLEGNKTDEINKFYAAEDWKNYTIVVHGIKSSMMSIGAVKLSEMANLNSTMRKTAS